MRFDNGFPDQCNAGAHVFKMIEGISRCGNCGIKYAEYQEQKQKEELDR